MGRTWIGSGLLLCSLALLLGSVNLLVAEVGTEKKELPYAIAQRDYVRIAEIFGRLGASGDPEAVELMFKTLQVVAPEELIDQTLQALRQLGMDLIAEPVEKELSRRRHDPTLIGIIFALAEQLDDVRSEGWLLIGLEHSDERVLRNAIAGVRKRRSKDSIPRLIDLLERSAGKDSMVQYSTHMALIDLTGQDFESIADWRGFWEINKDTIDPKNLDEESEGETGVQRRKPDDKSPTFFGVEIVSRKIMFVIDCSGSMEMYDEAQEEGSDGTGADWRVRQRILRARNQLISAIEKLPSGTRFNIVSYNQKLRVFNPKGIVPATGKWKRQATDFVRGLKSEGATHTDEALVQAFEDQDIDSIYLLSDGAPNHGEALPPQQLIPMIIEDMRKRNRLRKLRIFTFGFEGWGRYPPGHRQENDPPAPSDSMVAFLRQLASEHGGKYTPIH